MASTAIRSLPVPVTMTVGGKAPRAAIARNTSRPLRPGIVWSMMTTS